ncbi:hypothetical protein C8A01DRAFT_16058, partial [Parachaetomium inaequale]
YSTMIAITLLLLSFLQMALGGPLPSPYTGCYVGVKPPDETQCHQVIDAFSQNDRTGYITLKGDNSLRISVGSCEGTLINKRSSSISVNEATLAVDMTDRIFNHCVLHKMWGQIETDDYIIELQYTGPEVWDITEEGHTKTKVSERSEDIWGPSHNRRADKVDLAAEQKRDLSPNTTCSENPASVPPPVPDDCHGAILGLTGRSILGSGPSFRCMHANQ